MELQPRGKIRNRRSFLFVLALLGCCLSILTAYLATRKLNGSDSPGCRLVYMGPSFARIRSFDESHTKFASKYSLYLYREQNQDPLPNEEGNGFEILSGIPALFIPGNAGSYRQGRSIAAETSNLYFGEYIHQHPHLNPNSMNYDFFTADFNEDFTAFHGRTMLDQAEYLNEAVKFILGLYSNNPNPPKSVMIVGHSMGGVVARVMVSLPNYVPESINTIITLASPHAAAPLTFDGDLLKIYSAVDRFWYEGYHAADDSVSEVTSIAQQRVKNISLVSITGGILDTTLPADYTSLGFLVPPTNGFAVYTTGIPYVWTPIDHLAIVWCCQLRRQVARIMMEMADTSSPQRTYDLSTRMLTSRKYLLTGFEDVAANDSAIFQSTPEQRFTLKLDMNRINSITVDGNNTLKIAKHSLHSTSMHVFHIPNEGEHEFSLLSSTAFTKWSIEEQKTGGSSKPAIMMCKKSDYIKFDNDYTGEETKEFMPLNCIDISSDMTVIPRSSKRTKSLMDSSLDGDQEAFYAFQYNGASLKGHDVIMVVNKKEEPNDEDFLIADISKTIVSHYEMGKDLFSLIRRGADISIPAKCPVAININIPGAWSSMLAYKLHLKFAYKDTNTKFEPVIRQWSEEPFETKWHINLKENSHLSITMHGVAPYVPFKAESTARGGLNFQLWSESDGSLDNDGLDIVFRVDFIRSLRLLVLRYRLALVAGCVSIVLLVMIIQWRTFFATNKYPSFVYAMSLLNGGKSLFTIFGVLLVMTPLTKIHAVQTVLNMIDPVVLRDANEINLSLLADFKLNSFYLGLEEVSLGVVGIVLYLMTTFFVLAVNFVLLGVGVTIASLIRLCRRVIWIPQGESTEKRWMTRRVAVTILLLFLITLYVPYQLVYLVCFVVQIFNVLKLLVNNNSGASDNNNFNYQYSLLMLMLWLLPVNIPILVVFVHNLTVSWTTPFSSHHNLLSIMPILVLIESNTMLTKMPRGPLVDKWKQRVLIGFMCYFVFYCIVYGVRHTFWLHHLFNVLCCILLMLYYEVSDDREEKVVASS